ncbi:MAG: hypothetical protein RMJ87_07660 [Cytophagales bacterium]|nr:hypothetical protein [Bernardetiaceae bacterium]MDW8204889.1 hypothetical protein [Cytophagales bacterium]
MSEAICNPAYLYALKNLLGTIGTLVVCCWWLCSPWKLLAQRPQPARETCRMFSLQFQLSSDGSRATAIVQPDSLSLLPSSVRIAAAFPDYPLQLHYDLQNNRLILQAENPQKLPDSVQICYRLLPLLLSKPLSRRSQAMYDSGAYGQVTSDMTKPISIGAPPREQLFSVQGLQKNGSLTRGIAFGNRQDVFVQSALNLQLEGNISEDLHLTAVLTDQNVPFQPEGNTLQVRQFDRVLMKLRHKMATLTVGDVVLQNPQQSPSHFLRFYKNVLGGMVESDYATRDSTGKAKAQSVAAVGVAKGRFVSQVIEVQEGVLGPYRLRGPDGERFVIILANSEKVFLDNQLLTRGFNYDYVIDYNTGEITFTNRVVITRFSRVRVDVEFVSQNYARSILQAGHQQQIGERVEVFGQFYRERDNPRNPLLVQLSNEDRQLLANIGDSLNNALAPAVFAVETWDVNRILYRARDTMLQGRPYRYYERARQPGGELFSITFSEVGFGRGDYVAGSPTANGREYVWAGIGRGNFAPVRLLAAPNERQMATLGGAYRIHGNGKVFAEAAFSKLDVNMFSALNNEDNNGSALQLGYRNSGEKIRRGALQDAEWNAELSLTRTDANFRPIDRFRYIEFDRDWSVEDVSLGVVSNPADDYLWQASGGLRKGGRYVQAKHLRRLRGNQANGFQQWAEAGYLLGKWQLQTTGFLMQNRFERKGSSLRSEWQRLTADIAYLGNQIVPGYQFSTDRNVVRYTERDSIVSTAMNFYEHKAYVRHGDSAKFQLNGSYAFREDFLPLAGALQRGTRAHTATLNWQKRTEQQWFNLLLTYRNLENLLPNGDRTAVNEETLMGRLDWNTNFWQRAIRSELTLANNTGRELRREFVFLQVNNGLGTHTWRDDNGDGIQQLNEFYLAINPDERNYIKFFTPTDEYIPAYANSLSWRLNMGFPRTWNKAKGIRQWLAKFSNVSAWTINRRLTDSRLTARWLPFASVADSALLATQEALRSTLFFNRTDPKWGSDLALVQSRQKQLLTNGFESRNLTEWQLNLRRNFSTNISLRIQMGSSQTNNASDFMPNRNYAISMRQVKPELAWQPSPKIRLSGAYVYQQKTTGGNQSEQALFNEILAEMRWSQETKRNVQARLRLANIRYEGETNSPLGYEMLEALQPGTNLNWSLNWQQRLGNGLQLTLQYEGRRSPAQPIVHIGRVQVTALF